VPNKGGSFCSVEGGGGEKKEKVPLQEKAALTSLEKGPPLAAQLRVRLGKKKYKSSRRKQKNSSNGGGGGGHRTRKRMVLPSGRNTGLREIIV